MSNEDFAKTNLALSRSYAPTLPRSHGLGVAVRGVGHHRHIRLEYPSRKSVFVNMRRFFLFSSLLLAMATLGACVSDSNYSDAPTLYKGMPRERLKSRFGEPLRVERTRSGGEDWYYLFTYWANNIDASAEHDPATGAGSLSLTISDQGNPQECPVHLSADGYVTDPLPAGKIVHP